MHVNASSDDFKPCRYCGSGFAPKTSWQDYCSDKCRNDYHNKKGEEAVAVAGTRRQYKEMADGTLRAQIDIDPRYKQDFLRLFPEIDMPVGLVPLAADFESKKIKQETEPKTHGAEAKILYQSNFLRTPEVWRALGTDDDYRAWVQKQPSAYSREFSEYVNGEGRCIAAHVRRAGESGTGHKAEFACIPLTDKEHQQQHQHGESALGGQEWFDKQRIKYVQMWAWQRLREILQYDSMGDCSPREVLAWAKVHDIDHYLPSAYRDAH